MEEERPQKQQEQPRHDTEPLRLGPPLPHRARLIHHRRESRGEEEQQPEDAVVVAEEKKVRRWDVLFRCRQCSCLPLASVPICTSTSEL